MGEHKHRFREIGRVFPYTEDDFDPAYLSPDGLHHPDVDDGALFTAEEAKAKGGKIAAALKEKVPEPTAHVILQCDDPECKHIVHAELTEAEADRISAWIESGAMDPTGRGSNDLLSQASLDELKLGRIAKMLDPAYQASTGASRFGG